MRTYNTLKTLLVLLAFSLQVISFASEDFTQKQMIIIHDKAFKLIEEYQNDINQIGLDIADIERTKSNIELFIDLYVNRKTLIYNDLDPSHSLSEYYEIETYASNLALWYPDGQVVNLDMKNARVSNVINHGNKIFSIDMSVDKNINGNYLNRSVNSNTEKLLFRIAFTIENLPTNFKIAGVRNAAGGETSFDNKSLVEVKKAEFSDEQIMKVQQYSAALINDFANYLSLLGNKEETEDDKAFYKEAVIGLFQETDNNIYNDLVKDAEDKYVNIVEYLTSYRENYPVINNLSLNTDSAKYGIPIKNEDGTFYMEAHVDKFFSAQQKGKNLYRSQNRLIFKIVFNQSEADFSNFIFESIDDESLNQALLAGSQNSQNVSEFGHLSKFTRKGWYIGVSVHSGFSQMFNRNIGDITMEKQYLEWNIKPGIAYGGKLLASYMLNDLIGVETGLGFHHLKTTYSISSNDQRIENPIISNLPDESDIPEPKAFVDKNSYYFNAQSDEYLKLLYIDDYDSTVVNNNIFVPFYVNSYLGSPGKISFSIKVGIDVNYSMTYKYSIKSGDEKYFIYLINPENPPNYYFSADGNLLELNLYSRIPREIENNDNENIKKLYLDGVLGISTEIPLGYFLSISAGFLIKSSIMDLSTNKDKYIDKFGRTENDLNTVPGHVFEHKATRVRSVLFEVGIKYKL